MFTFQIFTVFLIGLIFGSFANVCIARLPKDKTIIFGRSKCPKCKKKSFYKQVSAPSFKLSGSGWYETDFKNNSKNKSVTKPKKEKQND